MCSSVSNESPCSRSAASGRKATVSPACAKPSPKPEPFPISDLRFTRVADADPLVNRKSQIVNRMVRLQKFLADAGVASRRASERIILAGRVEVNGQIVRVLGTKLDPARDRVSVDGALIKARRKLYVAVNKPRGYICSRHDPAKRRAVGDLLPREWNNLYPVGRLEPKVLSRLTRGVVHDGERLKAEKARLLSANNSRSAVEVELAEGKYREVRRLFESQGLVVAQLRRTQIGRIKLGDLPVGKWRTLTGPEIKTLLSNSSQAARVATHEH